MSELSEVHQKLRGAILRGDFAPRQRLIEAELTEDFGASRFVIRTALIQLASDGLVELQPNRGARVREISAQEAIEITEIRKSVEGLVAGRAAQNITDEEIVELRLLGEQMSEAVAHGELMTYSDLNAIMHARVRELGHHATANRIIEQLNGQMVRHQFRLSLLPGRPSVSLPEHLAIIDAVCARDAARAEVVMADHVGSIIRTLRAL
ncbi:GntR family transcriptional regulator [Subtercola sp. RTI3]|uniref:GntR family transcriptional regulator n=1 Tax=Subtercola sp. RTI3 TaxID=3048639 RepID=UPI002B232FF5|nr:GntR family transcriptional regulator [Subtercola sp. RTI3]MEA9984249.1 GntR family transcriptional regulator [Subtercola sp. RTI3]